MSAATDRLDSWKEIAVYLNRDVRTVQRWEKTEGLPVHRHVHEKLGTVYASRSEIEAWRSSRQSLTDSTTVESVPGGAPAATVGSEEPPATQQKFWTLSPVLIVGAVIIAAAVLGVFAWQKWTTPKLPPDTGPAKLVVLPFDNLSGDPAQEYFSDGMTEELIVQLGRLHANGLQTIAVASSMGFKKSSKPLPKIAAELGAGYVVQGSVRRSGDRVRIAAHLVRARDDAHLWDESYDRDVRDVLALQSEVAQAIARGISVNLAAVRATPSRAVNPDAYEAYLKGRSFWNKRTPEDLGRAIGNFQQAVKIDPTYAPAYVGIADCYALLGSAEMGVLPPREAMPMAKEAAVKALQLDDQLAEAHASLAHIKLIYDWDWKGAEQEFQRAITLNPGYATAHQWHALELNAAGRTADAVAEINRARELDPLSPAIRTALSEAYYFGRQYDASVAEARKSLEIDPNFILGLLTLGRSLEHQGKYDEAISALEKGRNLSGKGPAMTMLLAHAYISRGDRQKPRDLLQYLLGLPRTGPHKMYVSSLYISGIYAALGDRDQAFHWLSKAVEERCEYLIYLERDPMADNYRSDPRFETMLRQIGAHDATTGKPLWTQ
ncbi:MAG: TPR end-of-group domain-containing protein [Terriglobales bacterium]